VLTQESVQPVPGIAAPAGEAVTATKAADKTANPHARSIKAADRSFVRRTGATEPDTTDAEVTERTDREVVPCSTGHLLRSDLC
jgi:hypothetical protein